MPGFTTFRPGASEQEKAVRARITGPGRDCGPLSNATPRAMKEVHKELELDQCGADDIINTSPTTQGGHGPRQDANLYKPRGTGNTRGKTRREIAVTTDNQPMKPAVSKTGPHRSSYIHELDDWPAFRWNDETVTDPLVQAKYRLAELVGSGNILGEKAASELTVHHLTDSAVASSNIENEFPDPNVMRQAITLVQSRPGVASGNSRRGGRWRCAELETNGTPRVSKSTSRPRTGGDSPGAILRRWLLIMTLPSRRPGASPPARSDGALLVSKWLQHPPAMSRRAVTIHRPGVLEARVSDGHRSGSKG